MAAGITSVVDPALDGADLLTYQETASAGELTVRSTGMPLGDGEGAAAEMEAEYRDSG